MGQAATKLATYEDLLALPERLVGEIIHGALIAHPRPGPHHAVAAIELSSELNPPYGRGSGGPGGWRILVEPELHLNGHILVPDLSGWRRERLPHLPTTAWLELVPDWVCEILSPSTARVDRAQKMPLYASLALRHLWLIDPDLRTLEAYENRDGVWALLKTLEGDAAVSLPPFDATSFALSALWAN